jgi:RHS repeat-associated protein
MPISRLQLWPFVFAMLMICSAPCFAQVQTGTPPFGSFGGGPDIVNLGNLNVHINVPVFSRAGRGMPFTYRLGYDTSIWAPVNSSGSPVWTPESNWGWTSSTASVTGHLSNTETMERTCPVVINPHLPPVDEETIFFYTWTYYDSFGGVHPFIGNTTTWTASPCGSAGSSSLNATATDGSGYTISANGTSGSVYTRKGSLIGPPTNQFSGIGTLTDRNGNVISVDSSGNITDTLGTVALAVAGSGTPTSPITFTYTPPNGTPTAYTANFTSLTIKTNFGCSGVAEFGPTAENLLTSISLPDGTEYTFTYEQTSGFSGDYTGRLARVTLPTGGTITYTYPGSNDGVECSDGSTASLTRTVNPGGEWQYVRSGSGTAWTTTITDPTTPTNNQTSINFQSVTPVVGSAASFYETERKIYQGSISSGTLMKTIYTCYNGAASPCNSTAIAQPITQRTIIGQWPGSGGLESKTNIIYNSYGSVTEKDEYAYGAGAPGSLVRKTLTSYASLGNNIVGMPSTITVEDGSNNVKRKTTYCYDEGTPSGTSTCAATSPPTATTGTPQHVAITGSRGNITTVAYLVGSTYLGNTYTYYDTGNVLVAADVNGAQTTYSYGTGSCGNSFATSFSEPLSLSRSMAWNCTGGVETSVTDENSQSVSLTYNDPDFWRTNALTDQESNVATANYTGQTSAEASLNFNSSSSTSDLLVNMDGLGRSLISQVREAPGSTTYDSVETDYDIVGRPSKTSLPYSGSAGQTNSAAPGTSTTYDALNRKYQITDGGGSTVTFTYAQNDTYRMVGPAPTGENTKRTQFEYDALGRMASVCEITSATGSGSCSQTSPATGYWTTYTYDLNNNLTGVTQNAQSTGTKQTRAYAYDDLGRMTSETNPESGTTTYTFDSDTTCGTYKGDLVKKVDAVGNVICYKYDALHRLTNTFVSSGSYASSTPYKYFVYDAATVNGVAMANAKTRMAEAYTCATSSCTSKITDVGFSYTVRGETSDVYESTPNSGGYYHTAATYWANGALDVLTAKYGSTGITGLPTFTYAPDGEGRISTVSASSGQNPVTATAYNVAGLPTQVNFGSSDSDSFTYDSNTNRMTQYKFTVNAQSVVGTLMWNAIGTLEGLSVTDPFFSGGNQACAYTHDDVTRIASANCGSVWSQTFSFDAFGNISKSGTVSFQPTYSYLTNHMTQVGSSTPTYDANGNATYDTAHTYTWDAAGKPINADGVGLTYDALGRMVEQNKSGVYYQIVYAPTGAKFAIMNTSALQKAFVTLTGGSQAVYTSSGLVYYRHSDWVGSSRFASTPTRTMYYDGAYAPFGETYAQTGTADLSFTGMNQDTVANLYDFPARELNDIHGRWPSPDPAGIASIRLRDPQTWDRYAYVRNNPLRLTDPTGMDDSDNGGDGGGPGFGGGGFQIDFGVDGFFDPTGTNNSTNTCDSATCQTATACNNQGCLNQTVIIVNGNDGTQGGINMAFGPNNPPWMPGNRYRPPVPQTTTPNVDPGPPNPTGPPPPFDPPPPGPAWGPEPPINVPPNPTILDRMILIMTQIAKALGGYGPQPSPVICLTCGPCQRMNSDCI